MSVSDDIPLEAHRVMSSFGKGWIYYSFTNPAMGRDEPLWEACAPLPLQADDF